MSDSSEMPTETDGWAKPPPGRKKKELRLEYRLRPERASIVKNLFSHWHEWKTYHKRYRDGDERDEALRVLNRKDRLFEYRVREEKS